MANAEENGNGSKIVVEVGLLLYSIVTLIRYSLTLSGTVDLSIGGGSFNQIVNSVVYFVALFFCALWAIAFVWKQKRKGWHLILFVLILALHGYIYAVIMTNNELPNFSAFHFARYAIVQNLFMLLLCCAKYVPFGVHIEQNKITKMGWRTVSYYIACVFTTMLIGVIFSAFWFVSVAVLTFAACATLMGIKFDKISALISIILVLASIQLNTHTQFSYITAVLGALALILILDKVKQVKVVWCAEMNKFAFTESQIRERCVQMKKSTIYTEFCVDVFANELSHEELAKKYNYEVDTTVPEYIRARKIELEKFVL